MTQWYSINMGDALLAQPRLSELEHHLTELYEQADERAHLAACYRHENHGMHCHLVVFITAGFQALARLEGATRCNPPDPADISFLAGDQGCLERFCSR